MSTQPLSRAIRESIAQLFVTGAPTTIESLISDAGIRLVIGRRRVRGADPLLDPFAIRAPNSVTHHLYSTSVIAPDLAREDYAVLREQVEAVLFRYLNPLDVLHGEDRTIWLLSETEQIQLARVLALPADEEVDYLFLSGPSPAWTGPNRGLHRTMGALAQLLSRHPDFATGKVLCRTPATFLFLGEAPGLLRSAITGISGDARTAPSRGLFALDTASYIDALVQLGEEEARQLAAVEFEVTGSCIRAQGPLGIPIYRIPHPIPAQSVRSVTLVATGERIYEAAAPEPEGSAR